MYMSLGLVGKTTLSFLVGTIMVISFSVGMILGNFDVIDEQGFSSFYPSVDGAQTESAKAMTA